MDTKQLTEKQKRFINEYLIDMNAAQAAIRAGYSTKNPSQTGYNNLRKPLIRSIVNKKLFSRRLSKSMINESAVAKLVEIFTSDDSKKTEQIRAIEALARFNGKYSWCNQATGTDKTDSADLPDDPQSLLTAIDSFLARVDESPQQMTENGFRIPHFDTDEIKTVYHGHADQQQADQYAMQQPQPRDDEWPDEKRNVCTDAFKEEQWPDEKRPDEQRVVRTDAVKEKQVVDIESTASLPS